MQFSDQMAKRFLVKWKIPVTDVCSGWTSALLLLWNWLCWNVFTVRWYGCSCHKQDCSKLVWPWSAADPLGIKEAWSEIPAVKYFAFRNMSSRHFFNADWLLQYLSNPVQASWSELLCRESGKTLVLWRLCFGVLKDYRNLNLLFTWVFIFWEGSSEMFSENSIC